MRVKSDEVAAESGVILPPEGGRDAVSFGRDQETDFQSQNVTATAAWVDDKEMPFRDFYQIKSDERFSAPENMVCQVPITQAIHKGDVVLVSYWVRRPKAGGQPNNLFLTIGAPSAVYENKLSAYREWKQHVRSFVASRDVDPAKDVVRFDLGEAGSAFDVDAGDDDELHSDYFRDVMIASFSHPSFEAIVQWGFWEKMHWKPSAALWREDWTLKPCGEVFVDLVAKQWWTDEVLTTDAEGKCELHGFLGDYEITVKSDSLSKTVPAVIDGGGPRVRVELE